MSGPKYSGFLPGRHVIEGYGNFGFTFGGMSHRGSILALPSGIYAWDVLGPEDLGVGALAQVFAEPKGEIEHLLIGTGVELRPLAKELRAALNRDGIRVEPMATGAAARTYSILLGENRRVAAALIAVA
ncbi:MAG: MTH938/NDUFAF3 family protein [Methylovirgula sp.]|uniref:Mth938-like domain-containing protein n=1 Tax=Methylovirgula sp. TaxID=1978224 RepID=UPI003076444E